MRMGLPLSQGMALTPLGEELKEKLDVGERELTKIRLLRMEIAGGKCRAKGKHRRQEPHQDITCVMMREMIV